METNHVEETAIYLDSSRSIEERVEDLINRMTLEEKIAQLGSAWVFELLTKMQFDEAKATPILHNGLGHITRVGGASSLKPRDSARLANQIQYFLRENTRLGIPAIVHEECCSGYMARNATCFPQIIGLASTWEPELTHAMATVVRNQMKSVGAHQGLSPVLDVVRDPRWGRVEETFGEDPYLVALNGYHYIKGVQGDNWGNNLIATGKHFVGYGVTDGGFNWNPAHIPERELREVFLLPFEVAVREAGLQSMMNGYHELDGVPCAANEVLLNTILRDEWGFDGTVVADYFSIRHLETIHLLARDRTDAASKALEAGLDIELPNIDCYGQPLKEAVENGQIDVALVEQSVARLLQQKFALGLFENPYVDAEVVAIDTPAERELARKIAERSLILLKNEGDILPLSPELGKIAVIGPQADNTRHLIGDYAYEAHIESLLYSRHDSMGGDAMPIPDVEEIGDVFVPVNSILHALRAKVGDGTEFVYAQGCAVLGEDRSDFDEAVAAASSAEIALVFLGDKAGLTPDCTSGESRDRASLELTGVQQQLLEAVHATGTPTVLVLINGRPASVSWAAAHVPAIVEAWLPGEEGAEAVADMLFGDINPGGKLPITFPRSVGQIPIYYNRKPSGGQSHWKIEYVELSNLPLWPFGFGLSYTDFEIGNLRLDKQQMQSGETVAISVDVTNIGRIAGSETVQLYIQGTSNSVTRPVKELKGFKRVDLQTGEKCTVTFTFAADQCAFYDRQMRYVVEPGTVRFMIGTSSDDLPLEATVEIIGETNEVVEKSFFTAISVE